MRRGVPQGARQCKLNKGAITVLDDAPGARQIGVMDPKDPRNARQDGPASRNERLAEALRDNLRRRKAQARERALADASPAGTNPPPVGTNGNKT
jgi:hypothetical protein